jgi:hypothetical protein
MFHLELLHQLLYNDAVSTLRAIILYLFSNIASHVWVFFPGVLQIPLEVALLEEA